MHIRNSGFFVMVYILCWFFISDFLFNLICIALFILCSTKFLEAFFYEVKARWRERQGRVGTGFFSVD